MLIQSDDSGLLPVSGGTLYNNVFGKGDIQGASQYVFADGGAFGWEWNWPAGTGPNVKAYPEVIVGCSPWCKTEHPLLPRPLAEIRYGLDFELETSAEGMWCESFDFWITDSPSPTVENIVSNLCVWTNVHDLPANYIGTHETLQIGGRAYAVTFETPADHPPKTWTTLFAIESQFRSRGTLDLRPFIEVMLARGLVHPGLYLATAELGTEIASGSGRTVVHKFDVSG